MNGFDKLKTLAKQSGVKASETDSAWMFRTDRDYFSQLDAYRGEVCDA